MKRRKFLTVGTSLIGAVSFNFLAGCSNRHGSVKIGLITDLHYADRIPPAGSNRYYRESLAKLAECVNEMNEHGVDFLIELGDFKDQDDPPDENTTLVYLEAIENEFSRFEGPYYHVLGNHDHDSISKQQFLNGIENWSFVKALNYYSFDFKGFHFIVLDSNYTSSGDPYNHGQFDWKDALIPDEQIKWLKKDLTQNRIPTVVFIHHRLDCEASNREYGPVNADVIRNILEKSGTVILVVQGHYHQGDCRKINKIIYYTLKAAVEGSGSANNNYAILEINSKLEMKITGFRNSLSQDLT
jgi:predicted phosphodiesterase